MEDVTLSATGDVPDKNRDSSRTRDGRPLSATKSVGLKVVSFTTYILSRGFNMGFIKEDYDKFITSEFEKRLLEEHTEFSQTINNV